MQNGVTVMREMDSEITCKIMGILCTNFAKYQHPRIKSETGLMKVVLNIFNLSDRPVRFLQIFFDTLLDGYNVEILIKTLFMNRFKKNCSNLFLI